MTTTTTTTTTTKSTITTSKVDYHTEYLQHPGKPDYWLNVDGERIGYITVDRAGRSSGTHSRWIAWTLDGQRITAASTYTLRNLKFEIGLWLAPTIETRHAEQAVVVKLRGKVVALFRTADGHLDPLVAEAAARTLVETLKAA